MIQRSHTLGQCSIFLKQNPGESHLNLQELNDIAESNDFRFLMTKMSRYVANISGTNAYWHKAKEDLKAIITHVGAPTFFSHFHLRTCIGLISILLLEAKVAKSDVKT